MWSEMSEWFQKSSLYLHVCTHSAELQQGNLVSDINLVYLMLQLMHQLHDYISTVAHFCLEEKASCIPLIGDVALQLGSKCHNYTNALWKRMSKLCEHTRRIAVLSLGPLLCGFVGRDCPEVLSGWKILCCFVVSKTKIVGIFVFYGQFCVSPFLPF